MGGDEVGGDGGCAEGGWFVGVVAVFLFLPAGLVHVVVPEGGVLGELEGV